MENIPWAIVVIGGFIILGCALAWGYFQSAKHDRDVDPDTPGDDPSKGM